MIVAESTKCEKRTQDKDDKLVTGWLAVADGS